MRAKFIGADGSLGFRHGQWYGIDSLESKHGFILLKEYSGLYCLYSNWGVMMRNWEFDNNY